MFFHRYRPLRSPGQDGNKFKRTRRYYAIFVFGGVVVGTLLLNQIYYSDFLSSASSQVASPDKLSSMSLPEDYDLSFIPLLDILLHRHNMKRNRGSENPLVKNKGEDDEVFEWKKVLFERLDVIRRRCGAPCSINSVEAFEKFAQGTGVGEKSETSPASEVRLEVPFSCRDIFELEEIDAVDTTYPKLPPSELLPLYTFDGAIPLQPTSYSKNEELDVENKLVWTREDIDIQVEKLKEGVLEGTYGIEVTNRVRDFMVEKMSLVGKSVLVIGSEKPWLEASALLAGASKVTTLEYAKIESKHPQIETFTPQNFRKKFLKGRLELFDAVLSHSSVEHSGLGRYGDALNPWGDVLAVNRAWCVTKEGGSMMLGLPTCHADAVIWNEHRCYGRIRWPLITMNWNKTDGLMYGYEQFQDVLHAFKKVSYFS